MFPGLSGSRVGRTTATPPCCLLGSSKGMLPHLSQGRVGVSQRCCCTFILGAVTFHLVLPELREFLRLRKAVPSGVSGRASSLSPFSAVTTRSFGQPPFTTLSVRSGHSWLKVVRLGLLGCRR